MANFQMASKDGIPLIDDPSLVSLEKAYDWIGSKEPVISLVQDGTARAYPLQILTHHEIVKDRIGQRPVAVTFCPLCYSAVAFERTIDGEPVTFCVSGLLRRSDLVIHDRKSETLWQQVTGEAMVGTHAGETLSMLSVQLVSFGQFSENHPEGKVLSRETGYDRPYGTNPYAGYDNVRSSPFAFDEPVDDRLSPKGKVVAVSIGDTRKAYSHTATKEQRAINDTVGGRPVVVFQVPGAVSAVDARQISASKEDGTTGVFDRQVGDRMLAFTYAVEGRFGDTNTGSMWTVTGRPMKRPLEGTQLSRITHDDYFAFAWFAFRPEAMRHTAE